MAKPVAAASSASQTKGGKSTKKAAGKPSHTEVLKRRVQKVKKHKEFKKKRKQRFEEFKAAAKKLPRSERTAQRVKVKNQKKNEVPSHLVSEDDKAKKKLAHDAKVAAKRERRLKRKEVKRSKKIKKMAGVEERREKRVADKKARAAQEKATLAAGGPAK
ncbi:hypothetical protein GGI02_002452 [Coemansia sp. RSA 2322]|nr:hypothetical protein GGI02_002452 [Coemansia sp. RSA 2322]